VEGEREGREGSARNEGKVEAERRRSRRRCVRVFICAASEAHTRARVERETQAQHRRGAPVVSLGEVPGVSLSGLLGPSLRSYDRRRPFVD